MSADVEQSAIAELSVPTVGQKCARKRWTHEMNKFIWRNYLIITKLESIKTPHLQELHTRFISKFPYADVSRQRIGDQKRAIVRNNLLSEQERQDIKNDVEKELFHNNTTQQTHFSHTNTLSSQIPNLLQPSDTQKKMRWTVEYNEAIMRIYYLVTELETNLSTYRQSLHAKFIEEFPHLGHITEQRTADQRRLIAQNKGKYITDERLDEIRREVQQQIETNTRTHTEIQTSVEQTLDSLAQEYPDPELIEQTTQQYDRDTNNTHFNSTN